MSELTTSAEWELILVNNGSTDHTDDVIIAFQKTATFPVRVISENRKGLGYARNAGFTAARGSVLVFTDDDCYPKSDFLRQIKKVFEDPTVGYMGGRILLYDLDDAPVTIKTDEQAEYIPAFSYVRAGTISGANMAFRRKVFDAVGLFDSMLGAGTPFPCEDCDMVARASAGGWCGGYFPGPVVYHHHRRRGKAEIAALCRAYDRGRGAFYAKHLLRHDTRILYAKHWWWSVNRNNLDVFVREVRSAGYYLLMRLAKRLTTYFYD